MKSIQVWNNNPTEGKVQKPVMIASLTSHSVHLLFQIHARHLLVLNELVFEVNVHVQNLQQKGISTG